MLPISQGHRAERCNLSAVYLPRGSSKRRNWGPVGTQLLTQTRSARSARSGREGVVHQRVRESFGRLRTVSGVERFFRCFSGTEGIPHGCSRPRKLSVERATLRLAQGKVRKASRNADNLRRGEIWEKPESFGSRCLALTEGHSYFRRKQVAR
jgi:hypothetical protein